jgi:very-short-patch-repair endonuclease
LFVKRKPITYKNQLKALAKRLRKDITIKKILLWKELRNKQMLKNPPLAPPGRGTPI